MNAAIRLAVEMGLLEAISANGHSPVTASELAKQKHVDELLMGMTLANGPGFAVKQN